MVVRHGAVAIVPAKDEAERITATIDALTALPQVLTVIVVDDGSDDNTAELARDAGAHATRHPRNQGKAQALMSGLRYAHELGYDRSPVVFADADLEESAAALGALIDPVLAGDADLTIANLPPQKTSGGGSGRVVRLARKGIADRSGFEAKQPLSGQRCLTPAALQAALPFAAGWGVEVGMTIDVLRAGLRVQEVPVDLHHRVTGTDLRAVLHRAAQYRDVVRALRKRRAA
ncbi:glycosyltransferase family 2 protein [Calidifontibacter terrae]